MQYIVHKRFKQESISGYVNIPACSVCEEQDGVILYNGNVVCSASSMNAHQHFARNDDGNGLLRGRLTRSIMKALEKRDKDYQSRWNKIWDDSLCQPYRRKEYAQYWLWNDDFYKADIDTLRHIAKLVGAKEG